jgi:phosphoribosylamine--glycine ligase
LLASCAAGSLDEHAAELSGASCVGVVLATADYPRSSTPLGGLPPDVALDEGKVAFWGASDVGDDGKVGARGGRVLTVTALGDTLPAARANAYEAVDELAQRMGAGSSLTYRSDIALV